MESGHCPGGDWSCTPINFKVGDVVSGGDIIGNVPENNIITHQVMAKPGTMGTITYLAAAGSYTIDDVVLKTTFEGKETAHTMQHFWPVRTPRPVSEKLAGDEPLLVRLLRDSCASLGALPPRSTHAPTPADVKGTWGVWVANEKVWKDARDVKCVAVSATPGVYIHGPTPNQLLQDKLGEYRRVQQRVVTERGVYEMVGMPNVMMWYAPGGTWNIGKRDELGQNRGWYQAVSKAISPEGITNWQVWDGANRKWEKALELFHQMRVTVLDCAAELS